MTFKMNDDNSCLFERIRKGDETAFELVYKSYVSRLYYFVYEYVPNTDIVENIVQETFMTLWNKRSTLADNTNLGAYLFTVARNNCLYKLRDRRYKQRLFKSTDVDESELNENLDSLSAIDMSLISFSEIEQIIENTIRRLPPQCRTVFILSRFEDKKNREISEELGISLKTVEMHVSRALKLFRTTLKDYLPFTIFLFVR